MKGSKKIHLESLLMGVVLAGVLLAGGFFIWQEVSKQEKEDVYLSDVNLNAGRYDEGSLHYVSEEWIKYQRSLNFKTAFKEVWSIVTNAQEDILVGGNDGVRIYDKSGVEKKFIPTKKEVRFLWIGPNQEIYTCIGEEVIIFNLEGEQLKSISNSAWGKLSALVILDEVIFLADISSKKIWKCGLDGTVIKSFASTEKDKKNGLVIPGPYLDMVLGPDKKLYVSNPGRHHVNIYNTSGVFEGVIGKPSFKSIGFCGCCNPVTITVLSNGLIATAEKGISRVKMMSREDEFIGMIAAPKDFKKSKHSFAIDLHENQKGDVFVLVKKSQRVYIYKKKQEQS